MLIRSFIIAMLLMTGVFATGNVMAQEDPASDPAEEETMDDTTMEETGEETPSSLEELVEADPNLAMVEGEDDEMEMLADVLFAFGSAQLNDTAIESLSSVAAIIDEYPQVRIVGHTDAIGADEANLALGQLRAEAVRAYLIANSEMTEETIIVESAGETEPKAPNLNDDGTDNPDGRALNRRVVFIFDMMEE